MGDEPSVSVEYEVDDVAGRNSESEDDVSLLESVVLFGSSAVLFAGYVVHPYPVIIEDVLVLLGCLLVGTSLAGVFRLFHRGSDE